MDRQSYVLDAIEALLVILIGLLPAFDASLWWSAVVVTLVLVINIVRYFHSVGVMEEHNRLRIRSQLEALFWLSTIDDDPLADVRCTYHVIKKPLFRRAKYQQAFNYIPANKGTGAGRVWEINKGLAGKAFRDKHTVVENFQDDNEFREKMRSEYNYTNEELSHRTADRRSYLCIPLVNEQHLVHGVVFFDSQQADYFPNEESDLVRFIEQTCLRMRDHLS